MKILRSNTLFLYCVTLLLCACDSEPDDDQIPKDGVIYFIRGNVTPIYISEETLLNEYTNEPEKNEINKTGKFFIKDQYMFVSEIDSGIHILDNTDPSNAKHINFIRVPGTSELTIRNNYLYVNANRETYYYFWNYDITTPAIAPDIAFDGSFGKDLVVYDISDPRNVKGIYREAYGFLRGTFTSEKPEDRGIFVGTEYTETIEAAPCDSFPELAGHCGDTVSWYWRDCYQCKFEDSNGAPVADGGSGQDAPVEAGGSTARLTAVDNHLYFVDHSDLRTYDISSREKPSYTSISKIDDWGVETVFPRKDALFIGSNDGMYIYSLDNPAHPFKLSSINHVRSCDPVVFQDNYAFVTLRSGNRCAGFNNQLEIIDISDLSNPHVQWTYPMNNPWGLAVQDNCIFVAENTYGLTVFDATDLSKLNNNIVAKIDTLQARDVIVTDGILKVIGDYGLYQYEYQCGEIDEIKPVGYTPFDPKHNYYGRDF